MWKNVVERGRSQMTIWRMRIACWVPKATNAHTGCEILISFQLQQLCTNATQCYVIRTLPVLLKLALLFLNMEHLYQNM